MAPSGIASRERLEIRSDFRTFCLTLGRTRVLLCQKVEGRFWYFCEYVMVKGARRGRRSINFMPKSFGVRLFLLDIQVTGAIKII